MKKSQEKGRKNVTAITSLSDSCSKSELRHTNVGVDITAAPRALLWPAMICHVFRPDRPDLTFLEVPLAGNLGPVSRKSWNISCDNSLCIFKVKASRATKLCSCFNFYSTYCLWEDQLYSIRKLGLYELLFGSETFSGLSRNVHLVTCPVHRRAFLQVFGDGKSGLGLRVRYFFVGKPCPSRRSP